MSEYTAYFRAQMVGDADVLRRMRLLEQEAKILKRYENLRINITGNTANIEKSLDDINQRLQVLQQTIDKQYSLKVDTSNAETGVSRFQSMLEGLGGFLDNFGGKLQSLGGLFGGNLMDMVGRRLVTMGTRGLVSGVQRSVSRYDILNTFPMYAEAVGTDSERAAEMVQELNDAVLGLPTGLDEIVDSAKQYGILLDDLERGEDLAISMNNALLASGASDSMKSMAEYEVFRLLTSGTLSTSRQWRTLFQGLGAARQYIAKEMGYDDVTKWQNDLMGIAPQGATAEEKEAVKALATELQGEFIDALVKAGQGEGVMSLVEIYKSTLESSLANVKNAFANLGASVLDEIDNVLQEETGTGLVDTIVSFSDTIKQSLIPAIRDWLGDNPEVITDFLDKIKNYDWGTLLERVGEFASTYVDVMGNILTAIPPGASAFLMTLASPVGKGLSVLGGFLTTLAGIKIVKGGGLLGTLGTAGGAATMSNVGSSLAGFFGGLAKVAGFVAVIGEIGAVIYEFAKIAESISNLNIGSSFGKNMQSVLEMLGVVTVFATGLTAMSGMINMLTGGAGGFLALAGAAGFTGLVGLMGGVIYEFAVIGEQISQMDIKSGFEAKCLHLAAGMGALTLVFGAVAGIASQFAVPILIGEGVIASLGVAIGALVELAEGMLELDKTHISDKQIERVGEKSAKLINAIGEVFRSMKTAFDSNNFLGLLGDRWSSASMDNIVKNMNEVVQNLNDVATTFLGMEETLDLLEEKPLGRPGEVAPTRLQKISSSLMGVIGAIGEMFRGIKTALGGEEARSIQVGHGGGYVTTGGEDWLDLLFDKGSSNSMVTIISNMTDALEQIHEFDGLIINMEKRLNALNKRTGPAGSTSFGTRVQEDMKNVISVIDSIGEMFAGIKIAFSGGGKFGSLGLTASDTSTIQIIFANINKSLRAIKTMSGLVQDLEPLLEEVLGPRGDVDILTRALQVGKTFNGRVNKPGYQTAEMGNFQESPLANVINMFQDFYDQIGELFLTISSFQGFGKEATSDAMEVLTNIKSSMTTLFETFTMIQESTDLLTGLVGDDGRFYLGTKIGILTGRLSGIFKKLDMGDLDTAQIATSTANLKTAFDYLMQALTTLDTNRALIESMFNENDMFEIGNDIDRILTSLRRGFSSFTDTDMDFANLPAKVQDVSDAAKNMGDVLTNLSTLEGTVGSFFGEGNTFQLGDRLNTIFGSLNSIMGDVDTTKTAMPIAGFQGFAGQIDNLNTALQNLSSQGVEQATSSLEGFKDAADNAKSSSDDLKTALQNLLTQYSNTAGGVGTLISSMYAIMSALNAAAGAARNLATAINSIPNQKSISVNYSQSGSISSALGRLAARGHFSKGGRVAYRSYGGSIFRPRGTDTVPAMLTPGEYVMRRAVVNAYGSRFFQNLNNMNLAGALTSLTRRAGAYITPRGNGITNNYNRDNHAQVTQHIHTNNTNYALKRANRWVNAL